MLVDATEQTGFGHLSRCLHIANAVRQRALDAEISFEGGFSDYAKDRIKSEGFSITSGGKPLPEDEISLHDKYWLTQQDVSRLRKECRKLIMLDDFQMLDLSSADCVVNFRIHAEAMFQYNSKKDLLGVNYFPHPKSLQDIRARKNLPEGPPKNILIFVGGSASVADENYILEACRKALSETRIRLVTRHATDRAAIKGVTYDNPRDDFSQLLDWSDAVICGGGLVKYEAGYCGLPTACVSLTMGQHQDTEVLAKDSLTYDLGYIRTTSKNLLSRRIESFAQAHVQKEIHSTCLRTFVENSAENLAREILNL